MPVREKRGIPRPILIPTLFSLVGSFVASLFFADKSTIVVSTLAFGLIIPLAAQMVYGLLPRMKTRSFLLTVFFQVVSISTVMSAAFLMALSIAIGARMGELPWSERVFEVMSQVVLSPGITINLTVMIALTFVITAINQVSRKLGPGVLRSWITGKYHVPKEETRIFMFLDLKDSTTLAEQLGNLKFSALVKDFFSDMTLPALKTKAEVSHYIGDEAVLSWSVPNGVRQANCVRFFFLMADSIDKRSDYYRSTYEHVPGFKAGLHVGPVVATEVGDIKSEIVFHGDVMNTTARITGLCSTLEEDFLCSSEMLTVIGPLPVGIELTPHGEQSLKGKVQAVKVSGIRRMTNGQGMSFGGS